MPNSRHQIAGINPYLHSSCSKELFEKISGRCTSVLKKNSILDVSLESMESVQKFSEQLFFQNTNGRMLLNVQITFSRTLIDAFDWMRREISICSKVVLIL